MPPQTSQFCSFPLSEAVNPSFLMVGSFPPSGPFLTPLHTFGSVKRAAFSLQKEMNVSFQRLFEQCCDWLGVSNSCSCLIQTFGQHFIHRFQIQLSSRCFFGYGRYPPLPLA
eukprot:EG_transcript_21683